MSAPVAVGVDVGGTWIRFKGLNARGRIVWSLKKTSPTVNQLPTVLHIHLKRFHGTLSGLAIGSRGVWKKSKRRALKIKLHGLAPRIDILSDVEAAWHSAFKSQGVMIISGTGSIAYGRTSGGKCARAGGLGPDKGDEGSGYWIGREWLRRTHQARPFRRSEVRRIAALTTRVLSLAHRKDPIALGIVQDAQVHLATLVKTVSHQLHLSFISLSWSGSVLQDPGFRKGFFNALSPLSFRRIPLRSDTATALARSIMRHGLRKPSRASAR